MAKSRAAASNGTLTLEQRIANYLEGGRKALTPRQARRAAHKAHISTDEVRQKAAARAG